MFGSDQLDFSKPAALENRWAGANAGLPGRNDHEKCRKAGSSQADRRFPHHTPCGDEKLESSPDADMTAAEQGTREAHGIVPILSS